eukprot:m.668329 g.668329  ORF g.668329 m.668329 type:complete len:112 (+) comp22755_c0_seq15:177-512(+)
MLIFCPMCGNVLVLKDIRFTEENSFYCQTCPYIHTIEKKISVKHQNHERKEVADIIGDNENEGRPKADVKCPKCEFGEAYFHMMQTRSADEPSTVFYTCASSDCGHKWNEG